jgi:hypothetical protein
VGGFGTIFFAAGKGDVCVGACIICRVAWPDTWISIRRWVDGFCQEIKKMAIKDTPHHCYQAALLGSFDYSILFQDQKIRNLQNYILFPRLFYFNSYTSNNYPPQGQFRHSHPQYHHTSPLHHHPHLSSPPPPASPPAHPSSSSPAQPASPDPSPTQSHY